MPAKKPKSAPATDGLKLSDQLCFVTYSAAQAFNRVYKPLLDPLGLSGPGYGNVAVWLVMSYIWLPYMVIPVYAGLERIPNSVLAASDDLGAKPWRTFRRVIWPLVFPAVVAGSIVVGKVLRLGPHLFEAPISAMLLLEVGGGEAMGLARVEEAAARRGCRLVVAFTHDVQAPGLYRAAGYTLVATVEGYPAGGAAHWFRKSLPSG